MRRSIKQYQNTNLAHVEQADPHTLISLVMQHILGNLAGLKERSSVMKLKIEIRCSPKSSV